MNHYSLGKKLTVFLLATVCALVFATLLLSFLVNADPDEEPLNGLCVTEDYQLVYYTDGILDTSFSGFAVLNDESGDRWFYVKNGTVPLDLNDVVKGTIDGVEGWWLVRGGEFTQTTTVAKNINGWWYIDHGKVDFAYEGIAENDLGTWYLKNGQVSFSYNGFYPGTVNGESGWWYIEGSKVTFNKNDIIYGVAGESVSDDAKEAWWYVKNSKVCSEETVAQNSNGWWYVNHGKVDFNYNGFARNAKGWWYLNAGKVSFNVNDILYGIANNSADKTGEAGWWYVRGSKVTIAETVAKNANGWWYVKDGKVDFTKNSVEQNENGWWYIHAGKVDFTFNGFEKNNNGWWYLEKGKVSFIKNDILYGTANTDAEAVPEEAWWYIRGSKVTDAETVAKNANGWWYVKNGRVDFTYTGIKKNENGWWRIVNGKVDFNCNSVEQNENGWWYIAGGKVDFSFTGLAHSSSGWLYIKEGQADFTYNGPAVRNGVGYHVTNGAVDWGYSGSYSGDSTYTVKNGVIVSGWITYNGAKYYCLSSGKVATETVTIGGRQEVFKMDGRWIDTSSMDTKANSYSSSTNYLILVNLSARVTKIYRKSGGSWVVAQNYLCTVGDPSKGWDTIKGDHYVGKSSWGNPTWKGYSFEDTDNHTLYYWTRFCDSFLFHSQLYDLYSYNLTKSGNTLGEALSHGCVRLRFENAQWIYNNIPYGTRVIVY